MNFNDYIIDEDDFIFYESLPTDERILFLYDLICEEAYGPGSMEPEPMSIEKSFKFEDMIRSFEEKLGMIIEASIKDSVKVNIAFVNNMVVFNSNSEYELDLAVRDMMIEGMLLTRFKMTESAKRVFHKQKYCKIYKIIDQVSAFSMN